MAHLEGVRTPEMRQGRERLSVSRPYIEAALASLTLDNATIAKARQFGNRLAADAERWRAGRITGERGRISKADAARIWASAFPATAILLAAAARRDGAQ